MRLGAGSDRDRQPSVLRSRVGDAPLSDEALMQRAGIGDRAACASLVERHLARVVSFAYRTLGNRTDAEDAAQDVFLRVWAAAPRWRAGSARFTTWLHRVAMNVCLDRMAKKRETTGDDVPEVADEGSEPSAAAESSEVAGHVRAAVAALPDAQRIAITLCHYQGLRNIEAAEVMEISVDAVESLLARGRRAIRDRLRPVAAALLGNE
jgi:RNA polymerase sigma-70 factor, ECF subfamily